MSWKSTHGSETRIRLSQLSQTSLPAVQDNTDAAQPLCLHSSTDVHHRRSLQHCQLLFAATQHSTLNIHFTYLNYPSFRNSHRPRESIMATSTAARGVLGSALKGAGLLPGKPVSSSGDQDARMRDLSTKPARKGLQKAQKKSGHRQRTVDIYKSSGAADIQQKMVNRTSLSWDAHTTSTASRVAVFSFLFYPRPS